MSLFTFVLTEHPRPLTETLASGNTAECWQTETKNEIADLLTAFILTN